MQYRRARIKGATLFFTVVTHVRKRILCNKANILLMKEAFGHVIKLRRLG
jgi:REP element-mobilizing transposase RayT